jgi:hypothetical protein
MEVVHAIHEEDPSRCNICWFVLIKPTRSSDVLRGTTAFVDLRHKEAKK